MELQEIEWTELAQKRA